MPKFSVQICCYNSERYLEATIKSVLAQTFGDWELVMVNDGSTDGTEKMIRRFISDGVPIKYLSQENKGFASARNKAVSVSDGGWIAILDHDDLWYPRKLEEQAAAISRHPEAKLHFGNSEWFRDPGKTVRTTIEPGRFGSGILEGAFDKLLSQGCFIDSETAVIAKDAVLEAGGFNEKYSYIVDYDLFIKVARSHPVCYEDSIMARWRMHEKQASSVMKGKMYEEYVALFEDVLAKYELPGKIRRQLKDEIGSNSIKYSALKFRERQIARSVDFIVKKLDPYTFARFAAIKVPRVLCRKIGSLLKTGRNS